jgi:hypothetical protein
MPVKITPAVTAKENNSPFLTGSKQAKSGHFDIFTQYNPRFIY